ncbi:unnamed protein product [Staurois parvus]|uniref:Uncharacterized protein n=1 Tax=Staurois parvus TaxID=386267 RepID=A0ABN9EIN0_9NEOB|nr:unnamed protein product [Staurois parvus]
MSLLQCPRQCPLPDAGICHLGFVPCECQDVRGTKQAGNLKKSKSDIH